MKTLVNGRLIESAELAALTKRARALDLARQRGAFSRKASNRQYPQGDAALSTEEYVRAYFALNNIFTPCEYTLGDKKVRA